VYSIKLSHASKLRAFEYMPVLENQRWELYAQHLAQGKTATEAYVLAGFRASRSNAARLKANERIIARVREIQQAAATSAEINIESVCRELDSAIAVAQSRGQANAMVSAAVLRAKLAGLLVDKSKIELNINNATPMNASPDEILQSFWHSCTIDCPDVEIRDEDRVMLNAILDGLRTLEDSMIKREMRRQIVQDRIARQDMKPAAEIEYRRMLTDRQRLFGTGLFNGKGRPQG
jgi:hypothetical protein